VLTILREPSPQPADPEALALSALGWVLSDETHADRLIALTGITPMNCATGWGQGTPPAAIC
jgi:hypothetical protein